MEQCQLSKSLAGSQLDNLVEPRYLLESLELVKVILIFVREIHVHSRIKHEDGVRSVPFHVVTQLLSGHFLFRGHRKTLLNLWGLDSFKEVKIFGLILGFSCVGLVPRNIVLMAVP